MTEPNGPGEAPPALRASPRRRMRRARPAAWRGACGPVPAAVRLGGVAVPDGAGVRRGAVGHFVLSTSLAPVLGPAWRPVTAAPGVLLLPCRRQPAPGLAATGDTA
jgi:hypothetical protein